MVVYSKDVIDRKLSESKEDTAKKFTEMTQTVTALTKQVNEDLAKRVQAVQDNTYTKAQADERFLTEIPEKYVTQEEMVAYASESGISYTKGESDERYVKLEELNRSSFMEMGSSERLYQFVQSLRRFFQPKGDYVTNIECTQKIDEVGTRIDQVDGKVTGVQSDLKKYVQRAEIFDGNKLKLPDGSKLWVE